MRRATAWFVVVGVAMCATARPARAAEADGFWFSVAAGVAGSSTPTGYQEWWFETPHGPLRWRTASADGKPCDTFAPNRSRSSRLARSWPSSAG